MQPQVKVRRPEAEPADHDLAQKAREDGIAKANRIALPIEVQPQARCEGGKGRRRGPGLRRAGDRIRRRPTVAPAREPAEQLGQAAQLLIRGHLEQHAADLGRLPF